MPVLTSLGAPGVYQARPEPDRRFRAVPLDACAFIGIAPRGPARIVMRDELGNQLPPGADGQRPRWRSAPRLVQGWDEYRWLYGAFEGDWLLARSVAAFFRQGGRKAWIVRIVHDFGTDPTPDGRSRHLIDGIVMEGRPSPNGLPLLARNEGTWGDRLRIDVELVYQPLGWLPTMDAKGTSASPSENQLRIVPALGKPIVPLPSVGSLLEIRTAAGLLRAYLTEISESAEGANIRLSGQQGALPASAAINAIDVLSASVTVVDQDPGIVRRETFSELGLHPLHPRHLPSYLDDHSELVAGDESTFDAVLVPVTSESRFRSTPEHDRGGRDLYDEITPDDFVERDWLFTGEYPDEGVFSLAHIGERATTSAGVEAPDRVPIAMLCVPDLQRPPLAERCGTMLSAAGAGASFGPCIAVPSATETIPARSEWFDEDVAPYIRSVVSFAEQYREFVLLLDAPFGAGTKQVQDWRRRFDSSYVAGYHPWPAVAQPTSRNDTRLVYVPPSGFAAGVIAAREIRLGIPWGPARDPLMGAVGLKRRVTSDEHDQLHLEGVNVLQQDASGVMITAARTLSRDRSYRQLSVRRLMTMLRIALYDQSQWVVFEPNNPSLRRWLQRLLEAYLDDLFAAGAFAGATRNEAYFVNVGDELNDQRAEDRGMLLVEIGVAPVEPIEYLVLRLAADSDGLIQIVERRA
jgi:uncharacterized protein